MMNCPVCGYKKYRYVSYSKEYWGTVEQHGYCDHCGYVVEQSYSPTIGGFYPMIKKGGKDHFGQYHAKNCRKRKRIKRKFNIKYGNDDWKLMFI